MYSNYFLTRVIKPPLPCCGTDADELPSKLAKKIYVDSLTHDVGLLHLNLQVFGADKVALGTINAD